MSHNSRRVKLIFLLFWNNATLLMIVCGGCKHASCILLIKEQSLTLPSHIILLSHEA